MKTKLLFLLAVCVIAVSTAFGQTRLIKGQVVSDSDDEPLTGVAVVEKGTQNGTISDIDGNFSLRINEGGSITVSYVGYITQTFKVTSNTIKVRLQEDSKLLDDVVVVGYGVQRKSDLTGAVTSIKADDIKSLSTTDAGAALQGKAAGIQIINGGSPGAGAEIRVRGYSSNSGNISPLLIVDGVKVDNIQYLDPSNIASMEVLKDAASAAIYGAQAGNGVVIITTKNGSENGGASHVTYSLKATNQSLGTKAQLFNAKDYIDYHTYRGALSQSTLDMNGYKGQDTDWYDEVFGNSWSLQHNITVQAGNDKAHFMTSLGIVDNDGIVKGNKDTYKRLTAQINADYKIFKWLTVKTSNNIEKWERKALNNGYQSFLNSVVSIDPLTPAYVTDIKDMGKGMADMWYQYETGDTQVYPLLLPPGFNPENPVWYGTTKYEEDATGNPLAMRDRSNAMSKGLSLRGALEANLTPVKGLTVTSRLGYRIHQDNSHDHSSPFWLNNKNAKGTTHSISASTNAGYYYQWENFANYNKTIGKHSFGAMVGMAFSKDYSDNTSVSASDNNSKNEDGTVYIGTILNGDGAPNFNYINYLNDNGKSKLSVNNAPDWRTSLSYFGRVTYNYADRYNVQANFRRDAFSSEKLSTTARWGSFPSFSAGWTLSNEEFIKDLIEKETLSFLKVRGSWGRNGNVSPLSGYQYSATIGIGGFYQFNPGSGTITTGGAPGKQPNPNLQWETSEQLDLGIDARFLDDRLTFGLDWYKKTTQNLLLAVRGIPENGSQQSWVNTGEVLNQGLDIELGWRDNIGDFKYGINGNISPLKNEVKEVASVYPRITETGITGFNSKLQPTFEKGHKIYYFRGFRYAGVDKNDGSALYYDKNGEKTSSPGDNDKADLGAAIPTLTYGVTLNFEYKGFDLTVFGTGAAGNKIYNLMVSADSPMINGINTYWKKSTRTDEEGNIISLGKYPDMKQVATDWTFFSSDAAVFNGSYFKFKQIQLGYTLPKQLTKKALLSDVRFSVSLDDYFVITKYPGADPETSSLNSGASRGFDNGNYPMPKKVVFGVNLTF